MWFIALTLVARADETVERRLGAMGTELSITVTAADRPAALRASEAAVRAIEAVEQRLSSWRPDSELSRLSGAPDGAWVSVSAALASDLSFAVECREQTGGAFDPSLGAGSLEVDGLRVMKRGRLDAGGFGKGVGLDAALDAAREAGAHAAIVDLGGQLAAFGEPLELGVADPADRSRVAGAITLEQGSVATSGLSVQPGHIIDPRTGRPAPDFGSVTVRAPTGALADCLSTGLYVLGPEAALAWAEAREDIEVLVIPQPGDPR